MQKKRVVEDGSIAKFAMMIRSSCGNSRPQLSSRAKLDSLSRTANQALLDPRRPRRRRAPRLRLLLGAHVVAYVSPLHPEDYILGDVGCVVGNALKIAGDEQCVKRLPHDLGPLIHRLDQLNKSIVFHAIDK